MADVLELDIDQGAYWSREIEWQDEIGDPIDVTGYTARMQIRRKVTSDDVLLEVNDAGMGDTKIVVGGLDGLFTISISADDTAALPATPSDHRWFYDLEVTPVNDRTVRLLQGRVIVSPEVTRD